MYGNVDVAKKMIILYNNRYRNIEWDEILSGSELVYLGCYAMFGQKYRAFPV